MKHSKRAPLKPHASYASQLNRRQLLTTGAHLGLGYSLLGGLSPLLSACGDETTPKPSDASPTDPDTPDLLNAWWRQGNFAPVDELSSDQLNVIGDIPPQLNGTYLRNGPNSSTGQSDYLFDGEGMIHAVTIVDGQAQRYQSKYIRTPRHGVLDPLPPTLDNYHCNISILHHADQLLTLGEIGYPFALDPETLDTRGVYDFQGALQTAMTAHPKVDPISGELIFFGYGFGSPYLTHYVVSPQGEITHQTEIPIDASVMIHDFAITPEYSILMDHPVVFDARLATSQPIPYQWDEQRATRIGLLPRMGSGDEIVWVEIDGGFVFHFFNAWREGERILIEGVRYPHMWREDIYDLSATPQIWRWTVSTSGQLISSEAVSDALVEFPQVASTHTGQAHRYAFAVHYDPQRYQPAGDEPYQMRADSASGVWCWDKQRQLETRWTSEANEIPGETIFIADEERDDEEGFLMSLVYLTEEQRSDLVILDSATVEAGPIARIQLPQRVPYGFHGAWIDGMFL